MSGAHANRKLSACGSLCCTLVCHRIGEQVVCVINMPWNKWFITDVPVQSGCTDCAETPLELVLDLTGAAGTCPPKGWAHSALGLVKAHWNPEDSRVAKVYIPAFLLLSVF